ncbi:hypothetical protein [Shewanella sp.]|uniref:hypothetical protein n=1 Tax=Shewanella sp. TaxID=50422 RepID=UPI00356512BC
MNIKQRLPSSFFPGCNLLFWPSQRMASKNPILLGNLHLKVLVNMPKIVIMPYKISYLIFVLISSFSILSGCSNTYDPRYNIEEDKAAKEDKAVDEDKAIFDFAGGAVYRYPNENIVMYMKGEAYTPGNSKIITESDIVSNRLISTKYDGVKKVSFIEGKVPENISEFDITLFNMAFNFLNLPIETIVLVPLDDDDYLYKIEFNKEKFPKVLFLPLGKASVMETKAQLALMLHELNHLSDYYHIKFGITPKPVVFIQEINSSRLGMCYLYLSQKYFIKKDSKERMRLEVKHVAFDGIDFDFKQTNEYMNQFREIPDANLQSALADNLVVQNINNFQEEYCLYFAPEYYQGLNIKDWYESQFINKKE